MKRRIVSVLMALVMALSLLPVQALAEDAAVGEPVTEIKQAEETGEGEEPGDPEEEQEPEEPVREFVQGEAQLTVSTAAMAAGTAGESTELGDIYIALNVGGSLTMQNDVDYGGSMSVYKNLTIDLNGYVLNMTGGNIVVENGGSLTIKDSRPDAVHKFTPNTDGLWVLDETNGTKTVKGGVIYGGTGFTDENNNGYGGGVYIKDGGQFTMEGGNIVGCKAEGHEAYGGGVFVAKGGRFNMSGGKIIGCTAVTNQNGFAFGGGIRNDGEYNNSNVGRTTLSGTAEIRDCHAKGGFDLYGGGVSDGGTLTISGDVRIIGCTAGGMGADAMYVNANNDSSITGGTFYGSIIDLGNKISGVIVTYKDGDSEYAKQVLPSGTSATRPDDLAKPGYSFDGWYTSDGAQWDFTTAVTENITLTARWTLKAQEVSSEQGLTDALADPSVGRILLTEDIAISSSLTVDRTVTLDLNGYVLRYAEEAEPGSIFRVKSDCTLTMTDSRPEAPHEDAKLPVGGLITGGRGYRHDNGAGQSYNYYGGGVYVETGASFVLAGGTIYACGVQSDATLAFGGGIYADGGSVTMIGGAIRNCVLSANNSANGGGIYLKDANGTYPSFTMTGGVISGCSAMSGGGILASRCTVRITGGRIENCKASERGGGLYIGGHTNGPVSVLDTVISGCEAENGGGVALIGFAELELRENARIMGCKATNGAAIYMDLEATHTVNYPGCFLYANGGRVEGSVYVGRNGCDQEAEIKATNAIDHTDGMPTTVFTGDVYCEGDIRGGSFYGSVTAAIPDYLDWDGAKNFWSNFSGGSFYGPVRTEGYVSGGTFYDGLTLEKNAKLSGKPMDTGSELTDKTNIPDPAGKPVTVTYKYGELGETYAEQIVQTGEKAIKPDDPKVNGLTFGGWYTDEDCTDGNEYNFTASVTKDMTLTAKWTVCDHSGHTGAKPTCTTPAICTACGGTLAALGHQWGLWTSGSDNTHTRTCERDGSHTETLSCADGDKNHICDDCGKVISNHEDGDNDHVCDICRKTISNHVDADNNHICDICGKTISNHVDTDKNHICDDCGKVISDHVDVDKNHICDICKRIISNHADGNHDHICDICSKAISNHTGGTATCTEKAKCSVCGVGYGKLDPAHHANLVNVPAKAATTSAEGNIEYWHCGGCGKYYKDAAAQEEIEQEDTVVAKRRVYYAPSLYPVRNGTNPASGTEYPGGVYGLIFRAAVSGITGVQVDGRTVGRGSYTVEGSYPVELYLKASYLNRLAKGGHTLTVLTDSGSLTAAFTVGSGKSSPTTFDAGITVYAAAAVTSLTGLELLRRRRKEEE